MKAQEKPTISIILPVFNGKRYLAESIQSCIDQTYQNWELIIVDDCSTDSTPEIISKFKEKDSRVRSVRNETNKKLPASLNVGFSEARGKLFTWTSDDNRYAPQALERLEEVLSEKTDVDIIYSDCVLIDESGKSFGSLMVADREKLIDGNCVGACFLYRREVHDALKGYKEDLFLAEDYDFWLRAAGRFNFFALHLPLYFYRHHSKALTFSNRLSKLAELSESALERNLKTVEKFGPEAMVRAYLRLALGALRRRDIKKCIFFLKRSFKAYPIRTFKGGFLKFFRGLVKAKGMLR